MGWIFAVAGLLAAVNLATFEYGLAASAGHRLPGAGYVGWVELWIWVPFVTLITLYLFLLFPDGRLPAPRWRPVAWLGGAFAAIGTAGVALTLGSDRPDLPGLRNPFGLAPAAVPLGVAGAGLAGLVCCAVLAAWSLVVRSRRGTDVERQQIKWLAYSGCLVALALMPAVALSLTPGSARPGSPRARCPPPSWRCRPPSRSPCCGTGCTTSTASSPARWPTRIITGVLAGVYAALVLLATGMLGVRTPVAVAAATLAAAALFAPVRRRVQHAADRRFNRDRYDAGQTVAAFAARLEDAVDLDAIREELAGVVQTTLEPASVRVWTARPPLLMGPPMLTDGPAPDARAVSRMQTRARRHPPAIQTRRSSRTFHNEVLPISDHAATNSNSSSIRR